MTDFSYDDRAERLHRDSFVFDFSPYGEPIPHTARTAAAIDRGASDLSSALRSIWGQYLDELEEGGEERVARAQMWRRSGVNAVQVTMGSMELSNHDWDATLRDISHWHRRVQIGEDMALCTTAEAMRDAWRADRVGVLLGLQDTLQLGTDLGRVETLYGLGVRVIQLTYNRRNLVGDGCTERHQSGVSRLGRDLIREMNELGMVVDVSHSGIGTTKEAIELSSRPVAFTHTACRSLFDHPRAKTDEQLALLAEHDGYVGIVAVPFFLKAGGAGVEDVARHVAHAVEIVGIERVGIATDWGFWTPDFPKPLREQADRAFRATSGFRPEDGLELGVALESFGNWEDWPQLTRGLVAHGFTDDEIRGILGGNWLRFLERAQAT